MSCDKCNDMGYWFYAVPISMVTEDCPGKPQHKFCDCDKGKMKKQQVEDIFIELDNNFIPDLINVGGCEKLTTEFIEAYFPVAVGVQFNECLITSLDRQSLIAIAGFHLKQTIKKKRNENN